MRAVVVFLILLSTTAFARAQTPPSLGQQAANYGGQALSWMQNQWTRVQKEGRASAEKIVRAYPNRFRDLKVQVARMSELAGQFSDAHRLAEKKALLEQLWQVRGSVNLLALCSPDVIHELTGMDLQQITALQSQLASLRARLGS